MTPRCMRTAVVSDCVQRAGRPVRMAHGTITQHQRADVAARMELRQKRRGGRGRWRLPVRPGPHDRIGGRAER